MCHDKKARAEYLSREMALHDEATRMEEALEEGKAAGMKAGMKEGIKEGMKAGIEAGKIEMAKEMLKDGESIEKIIKYSKLTKEEILALN